MPTWQNILSLSRIKRHCTVQNLLDGKLACYVFLQVSIFTVALSFVIHVHSRGYVNLPSSAAKAAMDNPRITSYVVTLVATVFAFLNTILLGLVLQLALTARMSHPVSLQTLRGSISLITGQPLVGIRGFKITWAWIKSLACMRDGRRDIAPGDMQYWTWLKYTLMYSILCGQLTSSWTSFLTPTLVELRFDFTGTAVNYSVAAAQLQAMWHGYVAPYPSESSPLVTYMNVTRVLAGTRDFGSGDVTRYTQAGNVAASNELGLGSPYYIPFEGALYNGSTGGIFINASTVRRNASSKIPSQYTTGWTRSYTMVQQGLSADVQCRQQSFINATDTYPNVGLHGNISSGSSIMGVSADYRIQRYMMITNCSSDSVAYTNDILAFVDLNGDRLGDGILIGSVCKYQDFEKATNQSFLVLLQGFLPSYSFITPTICQVSPLITSVNVGFDGTTVNINDTTNYELLDPEGQQAAYIDQISDLIWMMMFDTQSLSGNSMATGIQMIFDRSLTRDSDSLNFALENYLRGGVEFLGTAWQMKLQPSSSTTTTKYAAAAHVQSLGYEYHRPTHVFLLVSLAVVVILTCAAAVYTPASKPKRPDHVSVVKDGRIQEEMDSPGDPAPRSSIADSEDFDPTNIIHLMMLGSRSHLENEAGDNERLQFHLD